MWNGLYDDPVMNSFELRYNNLLTSLGVET